MKNKNFVWGSKLWEHGCLKSSQNNKVTTIWKKMIQILNRLYCSYLKFFYLKNSKTRTVEYLINLQHIFILIFYLSAKIYTTFLKAIPSRKKNLGCIFPDFYTTLSQINFMIVLFSIYGKMSQNLSTLFCFNSRGTLIETNFFWQKILDLISSQT